VHFFAEPRRSESRGGEEEGIYVCKYSAAPQPQHSTRAYTRAQARGATPELSVAYGRHHIRVGGWDFRVSCCPPAVSGWGSVWVGLAPRDLALYTGFHDHESSKMTVRQLRPTPGTPRPATGAPLPLCPSTILSEPTAPGQLPGHNNRILRAGEYVRA